MQSALSNRGEMSQDSDAPELHPSVVTGGRSSHAYAPAAQTTRRAYDALSASSVGLELGISVIMGLLLGYWLDTRLGTTPWLMLAFLVLGLVAGFRGVLRAVHRAERAAEVDRG